MEKFKKLLRLLGLSLLILLALSGIGIMGAFNGRERYRDKEIKIELVDRALKDNEEDKDESLKN